MTGSRRPIPLRIWALWIGIWAAALAVFYGILTPFWMLIRGIAWASERSPLRRR